MKTEFNDMLELDEKTHETLGPLLVLTAKEPADAAKPYFLEIEEVEEVEEGKNLERFHLQLTRETALKLAWDILKRLGQV